MKHDWCKAIQVNPILMQKKGGQSCSDAMSILYTTIVGKSRSDASHHLNR